MIVMVENCFISEEKCIEYSLNQRIYTKRDMPPIQLNRKSFEMAHFMLATALHCGATVNAVGVNENLLAHQIKIDHNSSFCTNFISDSPLRSLLRLTFSGVMRKLLPMPQAKKNGN